MKFDADNMTGYFGEYGGQYIPEILRPAIKELEAEFKKAINDKTEIDTCIGTTNITTPKALAIPKCNASTMAQHDSAEILAKASINGQTVIIADCVKSTLNCVYVAWGKTNITATNINSCINTTTGAYIVDSKCLVTEAF